MSSARGAAPAGLGGPALDAPPGLEPVARAHVGVRHPNATRAQRALGERARHTRPAGQDDVHSLTDLGIIGYEPDQLPQSPRSSVSSGRRSARKLMTSSAST